MENSVAQLVREGVKALDSGDSHLALQHFEAATALDEDPRILSYLAFCIAKERKDFRKAVTLCRESLEEDPGNSVHYLNLGRIHLLNNQKREAIRIFRDGLLREKNRTIKEELKKLGTRKYPVISSLSRDHVLNKFLGRLFARLRLR